MGKVSVVIVAVVLFAAACGGGDELTSGDEETVPDAADIESGGAAADGHGATAGEGKTCQLLSDEEAERLLGDTVVDRVGADLEEDGLEVGNCSLRAASGDDLYVRVVRGPGAADMFEAELDLAGDDANTIAGLGDRAFVSESDLGEATKVQALIGDTQLILSAPADAATLEAVARAALERL